MKGRIVFIHYHGTGHINPILPLASILRNDGYDVHLAGVEYFYQYVTLQGFSHYVLKAVPFGLGFETWVNTIEKKKNIYLTSLRDRITDRLYKDREAVLLKMISDLKPDIILLDGTQPTDFITIYPHIKNSGIRLAFIHAMFPTYVVPGRPPVNSDTMPGDEEQEKAAVKKMKQHQRKKKLIQKLKYMGFDDHYIIARRLAQNMIPAHFISNVPSLFTFQTNNIPGFILAPREYDFPHFEHDINHYYTGFKIPDSPRGNSDPDFNPAWEVILERKKTENRKLIYCSFGTIESEEQKILQALLLRLAAVTKRLGYLLIVAATSQAADVHAIAAETVYVFKSVPQLKVLRDTDLFVTHGGLSSIKEAINAEVPMLMYAVHNDFDPKGNAARVAYHGLGLRGNAETDSEHEIEEKLRTLLGSLSFRENIVEFKAKNAAYTDAQFLRLIEQISPLKG